MNYNELSFIKSMFDSIACKYDVLNRILSLGRDVYWRRRMVAEVDFSSSSLEVLDVACGTADVAIEFAGKNKAQVNVIGVDFSENMLNVAGKKIAKKSLSNISLLAADALCLPFIDETFDVITMAFGIRNIQDRKRALNKFSTLLKPGGILLILELSILENSFFSKIFMYYLKTVLPKIGRFFSSDAFAYQYLSDSIIKFPNSNEFISIMTDSGFSRISILSLSKGIANLFIGYRD